MIYRKYWHQKLLENSGFANRCLSALRGLEVLAVILFITVTAGCMPESTLTRRDTTTPMGNCFPASVLTPEDMRARIDCHPDEYKLEINKDTVVLFAFPDPIMDWVGPIFIIHVPSISEVVLKTDGSTPFEDYKNSDGRKAIEDVLNNQDLLASILERARDIEKETQP